MTGYKCPLCRSPCTATSSGETLVCSACGFRFSISESTSDSLPSRSGGVEVSHPTAYGVDTDQSSAPLEIDGYKILCRIGKGGMGEVFKAEQEGLSRTVAIKVLSRELSKSQQLIQRFDREALALAKLQHQSIVWIINKGKTRDGRFFFAMEFVEGDSLRNVILEGKYSTPQRVTVVLDIAETLAYTHSMNIIHRDIKPENVLVREVAGGKLQVKILDFGLAGVLKEGPDRANLTREGIIIGTPFYMSPEQRVNPKNVDARTDIYSLGVMFYELLTGDIPVGVYKAPSERNPDVKQDLDAIVAKMLDQDLRKRYQLMDQVAGDVRSTLDIVSGRVSQQIRPELPEPLMTTSGFTTERKKVIVEGKATAGHTIFVQVNTQVYTTLASESGLFATEVLLKDGKNLITTRAVSRGQESKSSPPIEIQSLPEAPELLQIPKEAATAWVKVQGRAGPGDLIRVRVGDREYQTAADANGSFDVDCELDEGPNTVYAWAEVEGLRSRDSASAQIVRPVSPPWIKSLPMMTRRASLELQGTCAQKSELEIRVDDALYHTSADVAGHFDYEIPLRLGVNKVTIKASRAGVDSDPVGPIEIRRQLPLAPSHLAAMIAVVGLAALLTYSRYQPTLVLDPIPEARLTTVSGKGPTGSAIKIIVNEAERPIETVVGSDGSFKRKNVPLRYGKNTVRVKAVSGTKDLVESNVIHVLLPPPQPSHVAAMKGDGQSITLLGRIEEGCQALAALPGGKEIALAVDSTRASGGTSPFRGRVPLAPGKNVVQVFVLAGDARSEPVTKELYAPPEIPQITDRISSADGSSVTIKGVEPTPFALLKFQGPKRQQDYKPFAPNPDQTFETTLYDLDPGENRFHYSAFIVADKDKVEYRSVVETLIVTGRPPAPEGLGQSTVMKQGTSKIILFGTARFADRIGVWLGEKEIAEAKPDPAGQFEIVVPMRLAPGQNQFRVRSKVGGVMSEAASVAVPVRPPEPKLVEAALLGDGTRARIIVRAVPGALVSLTPSKGKEIHKRADKGLFDVEIDLNPGDNELALVARVDDLKSEATSVIVTAPPPPPELVEVKVAPDLKSATVSSRVYLPGAQAWIRRESSSRGSRLDSSDGELFLTKDPLPLSPGENRFQLWASFKDLRSAEVTAVATGEAPKISPPMVTWRPTGPKTILLEGAVEKGCSLEIMRGSVGIAPVRVQPGGRFQTSVDLGYGRHQLRIYALKQGGRSASSLVDALLPPQPVASPESTRIGDHQVLLKGQGEPGVQIHIREAGRRVRETLVEESGLFKATVDLEFGSHELQVLAHVSGASSRITPVRIDLPPPPPEPLAFRASDDAPAFSSKAMPATTVSIDVDGQLFTGRTASDGQFTVILVGLTPGPHTYRARVLAGGLSSSPQTGQFNYPPKDPQITRREVGETDLLIEGKVQKDVTLVVLSGDKEEKNTPPEGKFSVKIPLPVTGVRVALFTEVKGVKSRATDLGVVKPVTVAIPKPVLAVIPSVVYNRALTVKGQTSAGMDVRCTVNGAMQGAKADAHGQFELSTQLKEGSNILEFVAMSASRRTESESAVIRVALRLKLDSPTIDPIKDVVEDSVVSVSGQAVPGGQLTVHINRKPVVPITIPSDGQFSVPVQLASGRNALAFSVEMGDAKSPAVERLVTFNDTIDAPVVTNPPTLVKDNQVSIFGTAPKGSNVRVRIAGEKERVTSAKIGKFSFYNLPLALGENRIVLSADRANRKSQEVVLTIRSELPDPEPPEIDGLAKQVTVTTLPVKGRAGKGTTVFIKVNNGTPAQFQAPQGQFSGQIQLVKGLNRVVAWTVRGDRKSSEDSIDVSVIERLDPPTIDTDLPTTTRQTRLSISGSAPGAAAVKFEGARSVKVNVANGQFTAQIVLRTGSNTITYWSTRGTLESERRSFDVEVSVPRPAPTRRPVSVEDPPAEEPPPKEPPPKRPPVAERSAPPRPPDSGGDTIIGDGEDSTEPLTIAVPKGRRR